MGNFKFGGVELHVGRWLTDRGGRSCWDFSVRFFTVAAPRWRRCRDRRIQRGYTLLELILALSLSVVVLTLIFSAISLYVFQVTKQQARVERELVSRSVLKIVANDIRAALESRPIQALLIGTHQIENWKVHLLVQFASFASYK